MSVGQNFREKTVIYNFLFGLFLFKAVDCSSLFLTGFAEKPQQTNKSEESTEKETTTEE